MWKDMKLIDTGGLSYGSSSMAELEEEFSRNSRGSGIFADDDKDLVMAGDITLSPATIGEKIRIKWFSI